MKRLLGLWPVLPAIAVACLNVDLVVVPLIRRHGFSGLRLFYLVSFIGTFELVFWYWFWGWVIAIITRLKTVKDSIEFGKKTWAELQYEGYVDRVQSYFAKKLGWAINHHLVNRIKKGGYLFLLIAGVMPEPGSRTIGVIFCRIFKWPGGFYALAVGNVIHIAYVAGAWSFLFYIFENLKRAFRL